LVVAVIHTTKAAVKLKPQKNSGLNGIRTHDLCDTGVVLYRLSCLYLDSQEGSCYTLNFCPHFTSISVAPFPSKKKSKMFYPIFTQTFFSGF